MFSKGYENKKTLNFHKKISEMKVLLISKDDIIKSLNDVTYLFYLKSF